MGEWNKVAHNRICTMKGGEKIMNERQVEGVELRGTIGMTMVFLMSRYRSAQEHRPQSPPPPPLDAQPELQLTALLDLNHLHDRHVKLFTTWPLGRHSFVSSMDRALKGRASILTMQSSSSFTCASGVAPLLGTATEVFS
ncbi:hypothetical protein HRR77_005888 [Exophiala dermatitidis]|nr:hypothetical protein HRR77_005888 [Exophiala dermatitidis]KAJ4565239.1 hypothetical protein HRR79_005507 [Exophiala dermatitidis]KAJ4582299.1 hypothetical protein HRR82_004190 [Exophiala dermatitidis]KAJ4612122.1 hypothetical protein HRR85_004943 [Exophiala dermatitidis]